MDYEFKMLIPGWSFGYKFKYFWDTPEKFTDGTIFLTKLTATFFIFFPIHYTDQVSAALGA